MFSKLHALSLGLAASLAFTGSALALDASELITKGKTAAQILSSEGIDAGSVKLGDPAQGYLDLDNSGLHTFGVNRKGIILFDHSKQTEKGMDISGFALPTGSTVVDDILKAVDNGDGTFSWPGDAIPHPVTGALQSSTVHCEAVNSSDIVCAMAWF
ncbi:hypothetical protein [Kiloniella sp. b19]|uniref:hypothetical protein n=1 Tax=Kiloniella sp. GXU_MW_B19 TaxID=3141326 RepID=UPI0031D00018